MKLLHCSDIHLDIPFGDILSQEKSATRKQELLSAFVQMVGFGAREEAKAVLITGGMVDAEHISRQTMDRVYSVIRDNPDIGFYLLPGNSMESGYFSMEKNLPDNFHVFSEIEKKYSIEDVDIYGVPEASRLPLLDEDRTNIVLTSKDANLKGFEDRGIAYLGRGDERTFEYGDLIGGGFYCSPGSLEALSFDESGKKGFVEIFIQGKRVAPVFVRSGKRLCYEVEIDITGASGNESVAERARIGLGKKKGISGAAMVNVVLSGRMDLNHIVDDKGVQKILSRDFFAVSVDDREVDMDFSLDGVTGNSLRERFIREVSEGGESLELKKDIIKAGLSAIAGGDVI